MLPLIEKQFDTGIPCYALTRIADPRPDPAPDRRSHVSRHCCCRPPDRARCRRRFSLSTIYTLRVLRGCRRRAGQPTTASRTPYFRSPDDPPPSRERHDREGRVEVASRREDRAAGDVEVVEAVHAAVGIDDTVRGDALHPVVPDGCFMSHGSSSASGWSRTSLRNVVIPARARASRNSSCIRSWTGESRRRSPVEAEAGETEPVEVAGDDRHRALGVGLVLHLVDDDELGRTELLHGRLDAGDRPTVVSTGQWS